MSNSRSDTNKPDIHRLIQLHQLLLDFRAVERVTRIPGKPERENDVDHSYTLAMMAWFLSSYFPRLNRDTVIRMSLVHDLTEVHAGDTFVFGNGDHLTTKERREADALAKLAADWPDFPELVELLNDYEHRDSEEAKFVYALDKVMPIIISLIGGGRDFQDYDVTLELMHEQKRDKVSVSPEVNEYYNELLAVLRGMPHLFPKPKNEYHAPYEG
jgi:putative hydrolase of HD superfamily